jgi:site-specific DNA-methyltransferase (adenine-specific)
MDKVKLMLGDNIESLKKLPDNSVDAVVSDPPYALTPSKNAKKGFMGKSWDAEVPSVEFWKEVYRVLKPGGHVLSFGGTRTAHRMIVNIEDAGFEIRDQIQWIYGQGFPKSLNIGKILGQSEWEGWGTGLKPANEPICLARKPLSENTIAENVLEWGTGGINIDGCRIGSDIITQNEGRFPSNIILECTCDEVIKGERGERSGANNDYGDKKGGQWGKVKQIRGADYNDKGDIHTDPNCPCYIMDQQSGVSKSSDNKYDGKNTNTKFGQIKSSKRERGFTDKGGASRFFYQAKVSKAERNMGLDGFEEKRGGAMMANTGDKMVLGGASLKGEYKEIQKQKNTHPTIKPVNLMTYLCRLITPKGGTILDPFMGSGSTGIAALLEGFNFIGMEMDEDYFKIAESRINNYEQYRKFLKNSKND